MSEWAAKRFWKETSVTDHPEGFGVALDGPDLVTLDLTDPAAPTQIGTCGIVGSGADITLDGDVPIGPALRRFI